MSKRIKELYVGDTAKLSIRKEFDEHTSFCRSVTFFRKHNLLISTGLDCKVIIADTISCEIIKIIHTGHANYQVTRWDDNTFFVANSSRYIDCYSVTSGEKIKTFEYSLAKIDPEDQSDVALRFILKLEKENFIVLTNKGTFGIFNFSSTEMIFQLTPRIKCVFLTKKLIHSRLFPNSFYTISDSNGHPIEIINYKEDKIEKTIAHTSTLTFSIGTFFLKQSEEDYEYLLIGTNGRGVSIYRTSSKDLMGTELIEHSLVFSNTIYSFTNIRDQFILVGEINGFISFFDIKSQDPTESWKLLIKKNGDENSTHRDGIYWIEVMDVNRHKNTLEVATASKDNRFKISVYSGVENLPDWEDQKSELEVKDLVERIEFLNDQKELYTFDIKNLEFLMFIMIKLKNQSDIQTLKSILY